MKTTVVIPSNRNLDSLHEWAETDLNKHHLILVEDSPVKTIKVPRGFDIEHFCHKDIDEELKDKSWIISRGDSSIKSFGFLKAYQQGAENILCLDDDVVSNHPKFVEQHEQFLSMKVLSGVNGILNMVRKQMITNVPQKGLPKYSESEKPVVFSYGLWYGYLDVPSQYIHDFGMVSGNMANANEEEIQDNQYASISGMNVAFKVDPALPAYYQLLQGKEYGMGKWGDVWSGLFMQKICHHLGKGMLMGHPMVFHKHYGVADECIEMEKGGIELNELLWRDIPKMELYGKNFRPCYVELANKLPLYPGFESYMEKLKKAMLIWADFF